MACRVPDADALEHHPQGRRRASCRSPTTRSPRPCAPTSTDTHNVAEGAGAAPLAAALQEKTRLDGQARRPDPVSGGNIDFDLFRTWIAPDAQSRPQAGGGVKIEEVVVMAGLVPAIRALLLQVRQDVDARDKPGHDGERLTGTTMNQPASAYFLEERHDPNETHTLSVLVQNEPGVLARVIGLFSGPRLQHRQSHGVRNREPETSLPHHHRHHGHADGDRADQASARPHGAGVLASST